MSMDEKDFNSYENVKLSMSERDTLEEWFYKFNKKYEKIDIITRDKKND